MGYFLRRFRLFHQQAQISMKEPLAQPSPQQVKTLFEAALELSADERAAFLQTACADAPALRRAVSELFQAHAAAGNFLLTPPLLELSPLANEPSLGQRLGPYRLLSEIGRGGMATVYLAVRDDDEYQQQVAIKLIWPSADSTEVVSRFRQERQILAQLNHPHIARLFDGGTTEQGWPYLVMEYIEGVPLTHYCRAQRLSVPTRLQLFLNVCAAVAYAHQHLVIHRDLKPSNILVSTAAADAGAVKLLDFGIAKVITPENSPDIRTRTGLQWLTPEYASPEQVREETITTASDVYSLGVLLYELLSGVRPHDFEGRPLHEIIRKLSEEDPLPPSRRGTPEQAELCAESSAAKLQRSLRGDLDNIVLRALSKTAPPRYRTVEQFSDDLRRHLNGEPVLARPATLLYRTTKYIKRHKTQSAFLVLLIAGLLFALWQWQGARVREQEQRRQLYAAQMRQASAAWFDDDPRRYDEILQSPPIQPQPGEEDLRGLEWRYLGRLGHRERLTIENTDGFDHQQFTGAQPVILTWTLKLPRFLLRDAGTGQTLQERSLSTTETTFLHAYLNHEKRLTLLFQTSDGRLLKEDFASGVVRPLFTDPSPVIQLATNANGVLVTGHANGQVKQWEQQTGQLLNVLFTAAGRLLSLQQTSDLQRMATLTTDGLLQLWDVPQRRELLRLAQVASIHLDRESGRWLIVEFSNRLLSSYDLRTARKLHTLNTGTNPILFISGQTQLPLIIGHQDNSVRFYELPTLRLLKSFVGHTGWVNSAMLTADKTRLITASSDRTLKLWEVAEARELATLRGHHNDVMQAFWFDQDRQIASISSDHVLKIWDTAEVLRPDVLAGHTGRVYSVAFSPDSRLLASASQDRTIQLWDVANGKLLKTLPGAPGEIFCVNFSPDGQRLVSSGEGRAARVWDVASGKLLFELCCHQYQQHFAAFSPDGKLIATASDDRTIKLWDAATGRELRTLTGHTRDLWSLAFSPDSRWLATGSDKGELRWWDVASGQTLAAFQPHGDASIWSIAFTPDGQYFATASGDSTARLWRSATRELVRTFKGHSDGLFELAFSPDGQRLATASADKTVRFWNVHTGEELLSLKGHTDEVWSVAFAPDGNTLASGSWDKTVRLWRAAPQR